MLAEKGGELETIKAEPGFRIVATMNPAGDYGKKEVFLLSHLNVLLSVMMHDTALGSPLGKWRRVCPNTDVRHILICFRLKHRCSFGNCSDLCWENCETSISLSTKGYLLE